MTLNLLGKKRGMIQIFDKDGNSVPCTVIQIEPNVVVQIKSTDSKDGYNALQLGYEKVVAKDPRRQEKRTSKPLRGHYGKNGVQPRRHLHESRMDSTSDYEVGQEIGVNAFSGIEFVDAIAVSKGKGYQGVMKKYNFKGGPAAHGSGFHRHAGSTGMRSTPGRCFANSPRPSHMGFEQVTIQNLKVVSIDEDDQLIVVKGAVPGPTNGLVKIAPAMKKK